VESAAEVNAWTRSLHPLRRGAESQGSAAPTAARRIVRAGWKIAVVAVAMQTFAEFTNLFVLAHPHLIFDLGVDRNAFDWLSFCAALAAAVGLAVGAKAAPAGRQLTTLLALLVAFLAIDDLANLHDRLGDAFAHTLPQPFERVRDWSTPLVYLPLLVTAFALVWWRGNRAAREPARQIGTALFLLAGAIALRVVVGASEILGIHASEATRAVGITVLEGAELVAWILLAAAFAAEASSVPGRAPRAGQRG
jgi:hypothetical protein